MADACERLQEAADMHGLDYLYDCLVSQYKHADFETRIEARRNLAAILDPPDHA